MAIARTWQCGICHGNQERRRFVNDSLSQGKYQTDIEAESKVLGLNVKRETIRKHVNVCIANGIDKLLTPPKLGKQAGPSAVVPTTGVALPDSDDFATLVKARAVAALKAGELRVSTQDGLAAQALLDKREDRRKDRDVFVRVGLMLAGQLSGPPPIAIEGVFEVIEDEDVALLEAGT